MVPINDDAIRTLAAFKGEHRPVVTVYLDVDGRRWPKFVDCESRLERMVKDAADAASVADNGAGNGQATAIDDLRRIESFVKGGLDRSRVRGLAAFASGDALWQVFQLPVRVKDQIVVNQSPHVRQLERVVDNYKGFGVLLADKQRARMFIFELNELVDKSEVFDALPRHDDDAGARDRGHDKDHPLEAAAHQHLKRAAAVAFEAWKSHPFDHLLISAAPETLPELEADLHSYLKARIAARVSIPANASQAEITTAALEVAERIERDREAAMVGRLRASAAAHRGGLVGLEAVLGALAERRVDTLIVSDGYETEGWRCDQCRLLAATGPKCPICDSKMSLVEDVVEEAVEEALLQSCHVEMCVDNADLDVAGRIGALLRF